MVTVCRNAAKRPPHENQESPKRNQEATKQAIAQQMTIASKSTTVAMKLFDFKILRVQNVVRIDFKTGAEASRIA